jgi:DNA polymerase III epsilon subunit-like protein
LVDTLALAQAHYRFPHNSLEAIATALGVPSIIRHRAMPDVLTTHAVLSRFITDRRRHGPVTLAHLMYPAERRSATELAALTMTLQDALRTGRRLHTAPGRNATQTSRVVQLLEMSHERGHSYLRASVICGGTYLRLDRIVEVDMPTEEARLRRESIAADVVFHAALSAALPNADVWTLHTQIGGIGRITPHPAEHLAYFEAQRLA